MLILASKNCLVHFIFLEKLIQRGSYWKKESKVNMFNEAEYIPTRREILLDTQH